MISKLPISTLTLILFIFGLFNANKKDLALSDGAAQIVKLPNVPSLKVLSILNDAGYIS